MLESSAPYVKAVCLARRLWTAAALCLLVVLNGEARAQENEGGRRPEIGGTIASSGDADASSPEPLMLEPFSPRPLTPADFPPANPLLGNSSYRTSAMFGRDWRAGRAQYRELIEHESLAFGLPPALVDAVMAVESRYNSAVVGMDGEVGLMQVMLPTARMMGFGGTSAELATPDVNVHYGVRYLAGAWRLAHGDLCTATMKYRAGHGETRFSFLSVEYCMRIRSHLAAHGVPVSGAVPQPTFGRPLGSGPAHSRVPSGNGTIDFAVLNTRLRSVVERKALSELR